MQNPRGRSGVHECLSSVRILLLKARDWWKSSGAAARTDRARAFFYGGSVEPWLRRELDLFRIDVRHLAKRMVCLGGFSQAGLHQKASRLWQETAPWLRQEGEWFLRDVIHLAVRLRALYSSASA